MTRVSQEDRFNLYARGIREDEIRGTIDIRPSGVFARRLRVARGRVELKADGLPDRELDQIEILRRIRMRHAAPIHVKGKLNGILFLGDRVNSAEMTPFEEEMLQSILDLAAIVMDNADLYDEMRLTNLSMEEQNERLKEMDKLKTEFLSTVGHELRTPITCVVGFAECLRYPDVAEEQRVEFADTIIEQSQRLTNLIDQVLDLSALSSKALTMRPEETDLNKIVEEVTTALRTEIDGKKLSLDLDLEPSLPMAQLDQDRTRRAIRNLLDNAIKFSHPSGQVRVASRLEGDAISLTVEDQGVGIAEAKIETIFDPFRQGDSSDTRAHGGTGIGLSLVKKIVESQGGSISVRSKVGEGSVFTLRLLTDSKKSEPAESERLQREDIELPTQSLT